MKLRTEMVGPDSTSEGPYPAARVSDDGQDYLHDAAAAHALMQSIQNRMDRSMDNQDARDKVKLVGVLHYADELMREWGFGE